MKKRAEMLSLLFCKPKRRRMLLKMQKNVFDNKIDEE